MRLFVKNQTEDFIGDVEFDPEIVDDQSAPSTDVKLVIHDYSKDAAILKSKGSASSVLIRVIGKDVKDEKKLEGLAKYLTERNKAGMISYQQMMMYILPATTDRPVLCSTKVSSLVCLCPINLIKDQAKIASVVSTFTTSSQKVAPSSTQSKPVAAPSSSASNGGSQPYTKSAPSSSLGFNFLSSLANQV